MAAGLTLPIGNVDLLRENLIRQGEETLTEEDLDVRETLSRARSRPKRAGFALLRTWWGAVT